jgi:hypothetical protein
MKAFLKTGLLLVPVVLFALSPAPLPAQFGISVSINTAPPLLPEYSQPPCPYPGYLWEPGYWSWGPGGYYWVPGVWVMPPQPGLFWTPGFWAFENGDYMWNDGYWAPQVGFYGGVDYGYGYPGEGFYGGMWQGNVFRYNTAYWHVDRNRIHEFYDRREDFRETHDRASFNGRGGIQARPTPQDERAMHTRHFQPTASQRQYRDTVARDPQYQYKANHGRPPRPAVSRISAVVPRAQQRAVPNARRNTRPGNTPPYRQSRQPAAPTQRQAPPARRPVPYRPQAAQPRPRTQEAPRPQARPAPQPHPQNRPARPQYYPQNRPAPRPQAQPAPEPRPQNRPAPPPRNAPAPYPGSRPQAPEKPHPQG